MIVDALILAGGRSSRLGSSGEREHVGKQNLRIDGQSVLERSIEAARNAGARVVVVAGDDEPGDVVTVREQPPFAGPVAAIAAGLRALPRDADAVLVLACDMPDIGRALPTLLGGFRGDGVVALDRGRVQPLALAVRPTSLAAAVAALPTVVDASMRALLAALDLAETPVPDGATDDIDTWEDAARFGAAPPLTSGSTR